MWQVFVAAAAAAAAGSGYFAKHLLPPNDISQQIGQTSNQIERSQSSNPQELSQASDGDHTDENGIVEDFPNPDDFNMEFDQGDGVMASELDQKLCHLLIEQQESHIVELETKLQSTNSKLCEKEAELQALKDCVKRLTEFSIANASDEDIEAQTDEEKTSDNMECDSRKSAIGIKRAMEFES